jgi:prevent-host-death family protein
MREIDTFEAKDKFDTLLDWVANGEQIVITRHGDAVARLVPAETLSDRTMGIQATARIRARSLGTTLDGLSTEELVNEGRP